MTATLFVPNQFFKVGPYCAAQSTGECLAAPPGVRPPVRPRGQKADRSCREGRNGRRKTGDRPAWAPHSAAVSCTEVNTEYTAYCVCTPYWEDSWATASSAGLRHSSLGCRQAAVPTESKAKIEIKKANRSERFPGSVGGPEAGWCRATRWRTMADNRRKRQKTGISRWRCCNIQVAIPVSVAASGDRGDGTPPAPAGHANPNGATNCCRGPACRDSDQA